MITLPWLAILLFFLAGFVLGVGLGLQVTRR